MLEFKTNACLCKNHQNDLYLFSCRDVNFENTDVNSKFLQCTTCGSQRPEIFPSIETIKHAYNQYYTTGSGQTKLSFIKRNIKSFVNMSRSRYNDRNVSLNTKILLDYGCGSGAYLARISEKNVSITCYGTDIVKPQWSSDCAIKWISLEDLHDLKEIDLVTFSHVVEHLHEPDAALASAAKVMKKGGLIWIATPNAQSILVSLFGAFARDVDFPRHRLVFSAPLLIEALESNGFGNIQFQPPPRWNDIANFHQCMKNLSTENLPRSDQIKIVAIALGRFFLYNMSWNRLIRAPELVVTAQKL